MTSRMVAWTKEKGLDEEAESVLFYHNECFKNLQTVVQTRTVNGKLLYLLNFRNCLFLLFSLLRVLQQYCTMHAFDIQIYMGRFRPVSINPC